MRRAYPGYDEVVASMIPSAPFSNSRTARRRVLRLDRVKQRARAPGHARDGPEEPLEHVDRVNRLVHQRAAAVERPGPAPASRWRNTRVAGTSARAAGDEDRLPELPRDDHLFHRRDIRLQSILEEHADLDAGRDRPRRSRCQPLRSSRRAVSQRGRGGRLSIAASACSAWTPDGVPMATMSRGRCERKRPRSS